MSKENSVNCPHCGKPVNVSEVLSHQVEEKIKASYERKAEREKQAFQSRLQELEEQEQKLRKEREKLETTVEQQVKSKLKTETNKIEKSLREKMKEENEEHFEALQKELDLKSEEVRELNRTKLEVKKLQREKEEQAEKIALEKEKEYSQKLVEQKKKIKLQAEEESTLKIKELEKRLDEQTEIAKEAVRKAEQGSTQLQGEIQELELERILCETHRHDAITEIKKGQQGADVLQVVKTEQGVECGKIYYESKRTKNFNENWFQKFREDNLSVKADLLVLVTETMPDGHDRFFFKDGVWVCTLWEAKALSFVLRHNIIKVHTVLMTHQGKETKTSMLYKYLTSQEFANEFGAMMDGFNDLRLGYLEERMKMQRIWKEREKQLERIISNGISFYGSIKGIAGASIPEIKILEDGEQKALKASDN